MQTFTIQEALSWAWSKYKEHMMFLIQLAVGLALIYVAMGWISSPDRGGWIVQAICTLFEVYVSVGLVNVALRIYRAEKVSWKDIFAWGGSSRWSLYWKYLVTGVFTALVVAAGLILFIVPGVIWWTMFIFAQYFVVEKSKEPIEAMKLSARVTKGERWHVLGFGAVMILINIAGAIVFGVGLLFTLPFTMLACVRVYKKLSTKEPATQEAHEGAPQTA